MLIAEVVHDAGDVTLLAFLLQPSLFAYLLFSVLHPPRP